MAASILNRARKTPRSGVDFGARPRTCSACSCVWIPPARGSNDSTETIARRRANSSSSSGVSGVGGTCRRSSDSDFQTSAYWAASSRPSRTTLTSPWSMASANANARRITAGRFPGANRTWRRGFRCHGWPFDGPVLTVTTSRSPLAGPPGSGKTDRSTGGTTKTTERATSATLTPWRLAKDNTRSRNRLEQGIVYDCFVTVAANACLQEKNPRSKH